jgi:hypothetical protein
MSLIPCRHCGFELELEALLGEVSRSWPEHGWVWHLCSECHEGNHTRLGDGYVQQIVVTGAPGPSWEILRTIPSPGLSVGQLPTELNAWLEGRRYSFPAS